MSLPQEVIPEVFQVIEGGKVLGETAEIIQFPTDNGQTTYNVVQKIFQGNNGTGFNYWVVAFETLIGEITYAVSSGAALMTLEVGVAGVAIAPALGLTTGYVLYNLAPSFFDEVAAELMAAGQTIGGKVVTFLNEQGVTCFSETTIEIFKNAFLRAGAFIPPSDTVDIDDPTGLNLNIITMPIKMTTKYQFGENTYFVTFPQTGVKMAAFNYYLGNNQYGDHTAVAASHEPFDLFLFGQYVEPIVIHAQPATVLGETFYLAFQTLGGAVSAENIIGAYNTTSGLPFYDLNKPDVGYVMLYGTETQTGNVGGIQEGATLPSAEQFPLTFPNWLPWEFPLVHGQQLPQAYPLAYPSTLPQEEPYQDPAQNPDPAITTNPDEVVKILENTENDPNYDPDPEVDPDPDPDPEPDPDPIPEEVDPNPEPDPIDPNPDPTITPVIPIPSLPSTVSSSKLFTVYNPSQSQIDALGGYLWDGSIVAALRDIWQEPLDGLISLIQVYVTPSTSGSHNIILGFLDSGVSAAVVSNQFVTVDCGSVTVNENKKNATDYTPYTSLHLYLPFIGFVELDTNECMNATISIKYRVDVYTGTCLAMVSVERTADMPHDPVLYTYSGNCAQQIPLTSGNATGMLSALIGGITAGLSVASGGGLGVLAGASIAGKSLAHDMFHVNHSGNLSANAGIMGIKKPYLIIGRRHCYDANSYNRYYGFPVNKTVILGNHVGAGFTKVKSCRLKTKATNPEHEQILQLLQDGVIL